jgi:SEC-C motif
MGAIAEGIVAFAQPLLDQTDGSLEQMQKAFTLSQLCFNLALLPDDKRETSLSDLRLSLEMDDEEFDEFRRDVIGPMILRHRAMFPRMHRRLSTDLLGSGSSPRAHPIMAEPAETRPTIDRYAPCPCNSGRKYKFCCGKKGRLSAS